MEEKKIFINSSGAEWILEILGNDIFTGLKELGINCRKGEYSEYEGEEICFHMWWRRAIPYKEAAINAVFITHIDDSIKESDLLAMKNKFDIFICMSPEDAIFLQELGFDEKSVFGIDLPTRNNYVRPISIAIFSNCYTKMKTKNEQWLLDYCSSRKDSRIVNFCFIGHGWEDVACFLSKLGCSFEWHCVDRGLPNEYMFQQLKLINMDYYLYMGMDGGAMGTYDAFAMGVDLCVSDDGYHKSIPDVSYKFLSRKEFFDCMDLIIEKQKRRYQFFKEHSVENYVKKIAYILFNQDNPELNLPTERLDYSVKAKRRSFYFPLSIKRIKQPIVTKIIKSLLESDFKRKERLCKNCTFHRSNNQ